MQLVEEGKIKLDGKITDYLKDYRKDTGDKVTIHHLLTHTSGIKSYTNIPNVWSDSLRNHYEKEYFIKHFHSSDFEFEPGEKYSYNNTGYYLLAAIAEELTGKPFGELLKERIFTPAGMLNTGSEDTEVPINKKAYGYLKRGNGFTLDPYFYMPNVMGAGHMYSTVVDLFNWDQALYDDKILSTESKKKMFTPFLSGYGYGWGIGKQPIGETGDSTTIISHSGGINGFNTVMVRLVDHKHLIVLFSNYGAAPLGEMAQNIGAIIYGEEYDFPKRPIGNYLYTIIEEEGIKNAVDLYRQLKEEEKDSFNFAENELNTLGYTLMREGKLDEAIEIFKLNVEAFSEESNPYDSMGEAYMNKGEKELAIKFYKKSLEINPANQNGIDMLKKLGVEYNSKDVVVQIEILKKYVGKYLLAEGMEFTVRLDGDKLMVTLTGQPEFQVFPMSEVKFYYKVVNAQIEFTIDENGEANLLTLYQSGRVIPCERIE
jgi:CubicO group peptidase (beta-lactamase class C family)